MFILALSLLFFTPLNGSYLGVISILAGSIVTAVLALYYIRKLHGVMTPLFDIHRMKLDLVQTFPLGMTLIFNLIYFHSDSVVLTLTRSTQEVGIYGLAYKVFELALVFPLFIINAIYPLLIKANKESPQSSRQIFWQSFWILLGSSLIIGAGLWVLAPLMTFVRPDFAASILPLRILILSLPVFFVSALLMWILIAQKQQWRLLMIHTGAMIGNLLLNILFIPRFGYVAAATITGISEVCILTVSSAFVILRVKQGKAVL
jgi:O-antigen/teichoic acid export membrane protein